MHFVSPVWLYVERPNLDPLCPQRQLLVMPAPGMDLCRWHRFRLTTEKAVRERTGTEAIFIRFARGIPSSRENPKIHRVDDAEIVGDLVAVNVPVSGHVVAQKAQDRGAERLGGRVTPVVGDVLVHRSP